MATWDREGGSRLARRLWGPVAAVACAAALLLQGAAAVEQSLTMDEPYHLLAGHQALRYGTNTLNLEHPPLVKLVAALPLLLEAEPLAPPTAVGEALAASRAVFRDPAFARRVRLRARLLLVAAFALPFLAACFLLGRQVAGARAGVVLALALGLSFSAFPFLSLAQTDAALALGFTLALAAALAFLAEPGLPWAAAMGGGLGLALAAKLSALLLVPPLLLALLLAPRHRLGWRRRAVAGAALTLVAVAIPFATYAAANHRYDPGAGRETLQAYCRNRGTLLVDHRLEAAEGPLLALERRVPAAAQYLLGVLGVRAQNAIGVYPSYAFGTITSQGRWWYFPVVLLLKTPLVLLLASLAAAVAWVRARRRAPPTRASAPRPRGLALPAVVVLATAAGLYLATAMASNYNLGVRHLLPILPLLYLPAAAWAGRRPPVATALVGLLLVEALALTPLWMAATNTWWLGAANPTRFVLGAGDTEYKQNFIALARAAERRGIQGLGVLFPSTSTAEVEAYLPGGRSVDPRRPLEPGWYASTVLLEQAVPAILRAEPRQLHDHATFRGLAESWVPRLAELAGGEDYGYVAGTFHLYRLPDAPPAPPARRSTDTGPGAPGPIAHGPAAQAPGTPIEPTAR